MILSVFKDGSISVPLCVQAGWEFQLRLLILNFTTTLNHASRVTRICHSRNPFKHRLHLSLKLFHMSCSALILTAISETSQQIFLASWRGKREGKWLPQSDREINEVIDATVNYFLDTCSSQHIILLFGQSTGAQREKGPEPQFLRSNVTRAWNSSPVQWKARVPGPAHLSSHRSSRY